MLANAEMQVSSTIVGGRKVAGALEGETSLGGRRQIGRSADHPWHIAGDRIQDLGRCVPPGNTFRVGRELGKIAIPTVGKLAPLHLANLGSQLRILVCVMAECFLPLLMQLFSTLSDSRPEMLLHAIRNVKLGVFRPAVVPLGQANFFFSEGLAVRSAGVLLVGSAIRDVAVDNDESRPVVGMEESLEGAGQHFLIIRIPYARDIPPISDKTGSHVLTECPVRVTFDGDPVVVVDPAKIREFEMAGQRCGLAADAFHHATVTAKGIHVVVENFVAGPVEMVCQPTFRQRHADAGGNPLTQRTGRRFNTGGPAIFGMAGTLTL